MNALERVTIEGPAVQNPVTYEAIASYDFNRQLAINANTPPENSPSNPPPNQTLSKAERCENLRRQCVQDALELSKRLEEGCEFKAFGTSVAIPVATAACKAGIYRSYMYPRDNTCVAMKSQCLTEP